LGFALDKAANAAIGRSKKVIVAIFGFESGAARVAYQAQQKATAQGLNWFY
jgi:hypothetical protein